MSNRLIIDKIQDVLIEQNGHARGAPELFYEVVEPICAELKKAEACSNARKAEILRLRDEVEFNFDHANDLAKEVEQLKAERETLHSRLKAFDQLAHEQHAFLEEAAQFLPLDEYTRYKALSEKYAALCGLETDHLSPHQNQIL